MYTSLGVLTKGTIIEVNVSELGMVTTGGKVVWSSEFRCLRVSLTVRVRPDHQQPRERWLHQLCSSCLTKHRALISFPHLYLYSMHQTTDKANNAGLQQLATVKEGLQLTPSRDPPPNLHLQTSATTTAQAGISALHQPRYHEHERPTDVVLVVPGVAGAHGGTFEGSVILLIPGHRPRRASEVERQKTISAALRRARP